MIFARTELILGASGAKNREESYGSICFRIPSQKPNKSYPKDHQKIAKMLGITLEELNIWRKETRQNAGVEVKSADKTDVQVFGADERSKKYFKEELPSLEPLSH